MSISSVSSYIGKGTSQTLTVTPSGTYSSSTVDSYTLYSFTSGVSNTIKFSGDTTVEYLVVGGGGSGGGGGGGGGGAGGLLYGSLTMSSGTVYTIKIGSGGVGSSRSSGGNSNISSSSSILLNALGGGRGGFQTTYPADGTSSGFYGSGGGGGGGLSTGSTNSGGLGTFYQGFSGGNGTNVTTNNYSSGGGGGGYSSAGNANIAVTSTFTQAGNGAAGFTWYINGSSYAAGGGGGSRFSTSSNPGIGGSSIGGNGGYGQGFTFNTSGNAGVSNTGSGGGGGGTNDGSATNGGNGGSGIVIIAYKSIGQTDILPYTTNIVAWLDPTNSSTLSLSGSNVSNWYNRAGSVRSSTVVSGATGAVTYVSSGINSKPCVYIDSRTSTSYINLSIPATTFSSGVTMFVIYRYLGGASNPCLIQRAKGNLANPWDFYSNTRNISNGSSTGENITDTTTFSTQDTDSLFIATINSTTKTLKTFLNGTTFTTSFSATYSDTTVSNVYVGARQDLGTRANTYFGDIILFSEALANANIQSMESYLKSKWGLSYTGSW